MSQMTEPAAVETVPQRGWRRAPPVAISLVILAMALRALSAEFSTHGYAAIRHAFREISATQVVLTPADAQRLGFAQGELVYDQKVITANGPSYAALITLNSVGVGQSTVRNVQALVVKEGLTTSLLGMSYLGRLSRFEATPSSLILHP